MRLKGGEFMRALILIFSLLLLAEPVGATSKRVVSTSLCSDAYVIDAVNPENIAALSWQHTHAISAAPQNLRTKANAWDDIERLLSLKPDLVVFGPGEGQGAIPVLKKTGTPYIRLNWAQDFNDVTQNRAMLAKALGREKPIPKITPAKNNGKPPKVLYLSASAGSAGKGTYVDAVIARAGGENIFTQSGWFTPTLETLLGLKPDLVVTSFLRDGYASVNENAKRHFVVRQLIEKTPHTNVPGKLWPCAGPHLVDASRIVSQALEDLK